MRYIIEIILKITIVFINHAVNSSIVNQIKLIFNNFNKFNFRLIKAFIYLFQFQLNIKYRSEKQHVIFNVFSRLSVVVKDFGDSKSNDFDALNLNIFYNHSNSLIIIDLTFYHESIQDFESNTVYTYQNLTIVMFSEFKEKLLTNY